MARGVPGSVSSTMPPPKHLKQLTGGPHPQHRGSGGFTGANLGGSGGGGTPSAEWG